MKRGFRGDHVPFSLPLLLAWILLCSVPQAAGQTRQLPPAPVGNDRNLQVFHAGEELVYDVSYLGIGLGSITTRINSVDTSRGKRRYAAECLIRTYRGVPFVTLNTLFRSIMGDSLESVYFRNREFLSDDSSFKIIEYNFLKNRNRVHIKERTDKHPDWTKDTTLSLDGKRWQDGLSLFFFARAFSHTTQTRHVPVLMYLTKATTEIRFGVDRESESIDAVDYDIRCRKLEGETGFTGIFGLTGGFEGWFSDDAAAVPIRAKMHVIIGSVRIELVKWTRKGWKPPRASA